MLHDDALASQRFQVSLRKSVFPEHLERVFPQDGRCAADRFPQAAVESNRAAHLPHRAELCVLHLFHEPRVQHLLIREDWQAKQKRENPDHHAVEN